MSMLDVSSQKTLLKTAILGLIAGAAFSSRLFSIVRYESVIHEFDPWFNYRATQMLVKDGFYEFWNWFDDRSWYPLGRVVGGTVYPGLMVTAAVIHNILHFFNFPVDIRNVCVLLAPVFSGATAYATYLLTTELKDSSAGLLAAAFIGIAPGYISRSVAGSYDNEAIAIFLLMFTFFLWIKALKTGSALWASLSAFFYFYMVAAWGGYVFIINMIPLHVFVLMLMGRFSSRVYVSYSTFYVLGTLMSMQIPFVGFQPTRTSEHMAALGVFGLCQIMGFVDLLRGHLPAKQFQVLLKAFVLGSFVIGFSALVLLTMSGFIAPWTGRFYSLWDTGYAKIHIPIIASVSEHQPTAWASFFFDLEMLIFLFPAGIYMCFQKLRDEHVFVIVYGIFASYFAGVMVRLMLTLTPVVCICAGIAVSTILDTYLDLSNEKSTAIEEENSELIGTESTISSTSTSTSTSSSSSSSSITTKTTTVTKKGKTTKVTTKEVKDVKNGTDGKDKSSKGSKSKNGEKKYYGILTRDSRVVVVVSFVFFLCVFVWHCTWVTSNAYSSPSIVLASRNPDGSQHIIDDFREAYYWLRKNTKEDAKIMSWWDYGYQIAGMADRPTLVDNNTWNNTHIATVGRAMSSNEEDSYEIMKQHDVDYVLVIFGGLLGYSGDDINKYLWMIRIAEGVWPDKIKESDYFTPQGDYRVDDQASPAMKNSLMYKMSYYRFHELYNGQQPMDRVRQQRLPAQGPELNVLDEAFTSENWIVRIYKVKDYDNLGRPHSMAKAFEAGKKKKKTTRSQKSKERRRRTDLD
ncbi:Oligosaccharyl transferase STT3 subunit-domain-containing protein [Phycomyces blakesleeanus]|uniref:dolichyl-diphosphooligosaccharide--protein glycotransferase n=1 Tax=Phycomyces blakesleeanus TaxID=4837 RepID=A0ABR3B4H3_PHYBL